MSAVLTWNRREFLKTGATGTASSAAWTAAATSIPTRLPPIAPAVCNALFAATGKPIHQLPIRREDLV